MTYAIFTRSCFLFASMRSTALRKARELSNLARHYHDDSELTKNVIILLSSLSQHDFAVTLSLVIVVVSPYVLYVHVVVVVVVVLWCCCYLLYSKKNF